MNEETKAIIKNAVTEYLTWRQDQLYKLNILNPIEFEDGMICMNQMDTMSMNNLLKLIETCESKQTTSA